MSFRRTYIIGAGATYKAGMPLGVNLLKDVIEFSLKDKEKKATAELVQSNIRVIDGLFGYAKTGEYPNFEKYLNDVFDNMSISKKVNAIKVLDNGIDKDAISLLYWYFYHIIRNGGSEKASEYIPEFIFNEISEEDAIISLNYEWLFEYVYFLKFESNDIMTLKTKCKEQVPLNIINNQYCKKSGNIFKPHGSINWIIGKKGASVFLRFPDNSEKEYHLGDIDFPPLFEDENGTGVYLYSTYRSSEQLYSGVLLGIVPPQGYKGRYGAADTCIKLGTADIALKKEYTLLGNLLDKEKTRAIDAINASKEIWFIGTLLASDEYLIDEIKKFSKDKQIVVIDPNKEYAIELKNKLQADMLYYKNKNLEEYSRQITNNNMKNLDLNDSNLFEPIK